jgi:hypothetical protein
MQTLPLPIVALPRHSKRWHGEESLLQFGADAIRARIVALEKDILVVRYVLQINAKLHCCPA